MVERARNSPRRSSAVHLVPDDTGAVPADASGPTERVEAFVVRTALDDAGKPLRSRIVHVRSRAEASSTGWHPDDLVHFMEDCLRLPRSSRPPVTLARRPAEGSGRHAVDLDAGTVVGGRVRDVEIAIATTGRSQLSYEAVLSARPFPRGAADDQVRTTLATLRDSAEAGERLDLRFASVNLPTGLQRLRLSVTASSTGDDPPPVFTLVGRVGQA